MWYSVVLLIFSLILAYAMKGYGWSLDFPLFVIPLAYSFFAFYINIKGLCKPKRSFLIVLGILLIFNLANYLSYLMFNDWSHGDHEFRAVSLTIAGIQVAVYVASQALLLGSLTLWRKRRI